jgi:hypothetical protein
MWSKGDITCMTFLWGAIFGFLLGLSLASLVWGLLTLTDHLHMNSAICTTDPYEPDYDGYEPPKFGKFKGKNNASR